MKGARAPGIDSRRTPELSAELRERARAWIPSWGLADGERDFGRALLEVAGRFSAEVAERLDRAGEKMRRGFLDFLAVRGKAARPARMPVVFKLADTATESVFAEAPVQMQVDADGANVIFETEENVRLVPGALEIVVGVDGAADAVYLPPPGLSDLEPLTPLPTQWQLKSFAAAGATTLQLDPEAGLVKELVVETGTQQYRLTKVEQEIVTIDPPLTSELPAQTILRKVTAFAPFDGKTRNRQEHAIYLGHTEMLDIESKATISIVGAHSLRENVKWEYWGTTETDEEADWRKLELHVVQQPGEVVLVKPKGALVTTEIDGKSSRWIRGVTKNVAPAQAAFQPATLALRVNANDCKKDIPCGEVTGESAPVEGLANTTPLTLDKPFLPLGREPRLFDAFYLGSTEVFSKKEAKVQLCFEMTDPTYEALSTIEYDDGTVTDRVIAGVGADGKLHLLKFTAGDPPKIERYRDRDGLQPPAPGFNGQAERVNTVQLDAKPPWRPPMWKESSDFLVATTAEASVWVWRETPVATSSGWRLFPSVPGATETSRAKVDGIVHLEGSPQKLVALREGILSVLDLPGGSSWTPVPTTDVDTLETVVLKSIVAVMADTGGGLKTAVGHGLVGISGDGNVYSVSISGACKQLLSGADPKIRPAAALTDTTTLTVVAATAPNPPRLITTAGSQIQELEDGANLTGGLEVVLVGEGHWHFLAAVSAPGGDYLGSWEATNPAADLFVSPIPGPRGRLGGGPTAFPGHVVIPGSQADIFAATFNPSDRFPESGVVNPGVVLSLPAPELTEGDFVARVGNVPVARGITGVTDPHDGEVLYPLDLFFAKGASGPLLAYRIDSLPSGNVTADDTLSLAPGDLDAAEGMWLLVKSQTQSQLQRIVSLNRDTDPWVAKVTPGGLLVLNPPVEYAKPVTTNGRTAPFITLASVNWDLKLLERTKLVFPGLTPRRQRARAFNEDGNVFIVLAEDFTPAPVGQVTFIVDGAVGEWSRHLGDVGSNPELSWEYWNGKGWWGLDITLDETRHLKNTGAVRFVVPDDIAPGDVAGRTNFWIRARLIGGDYGKEKVTIKQLDNNSQTFERTTDAQPPSVISVHVSYRLCASVRPAFVLAQDSGTIRDQSDANRTRGAFVEAFVPLAVTLGRLSGTGASEEEDETGECPAPCACPGSETSTTTASVPASTPPTTAPLRLATGRALFIGLTASPSGTPVNVLLLVDKEAPHDSFAPMKIDALVADHFVPIVVEDTTRALGESGLLSMSFAVAPTPRELFGKENLTWLRLTPNAVGDVSKWTPALRGAYLNAVFANSAETLTRELLGSSEGAPNLVVRVARPPVLDDSLELRVKEPLGEEERDELLRQDENRVLRDVEGLPGDWVLWDRVIDPGDEDPPARVYALNEETGEIRFGDGQHGMIPPIGRDSIVAFRYKRTEAGASEGEDVPANTITARTTLNLVSPVESVEAVFAADRAAGGAPPESAERVVEFGTARLRHRDRAVTARDLEDLALESSPDVVQARCLVKPGRVRLIVVMRGASPRPDAAEVRELQRLLLASAPASLAAALKIDGPRVRNLRVALKLRVESLDDAGEVARSVQERIGALFDSATGGIHDAGWPLGAEPTDEEIAFALIDTPLLEGIAGVKLREVLADETEIPWKGAVRREELVMLAKDAVRLEFETVEVFA